MFCLSPKTASSFGPSFAPLRLAAVAADGDGPLEAEAIYVRAERSLSAAA